MNSHIQIIGNNPSYSNIISLGVLPMNTERMELIP